MTNKALPASSLRVRITFYTGLLITILMAVISISIIFTWRSLIIENEVENAIELTRAFSIPMLDALIYSGNNLGYPDVQIQSQITDFHEKVPNILFIHLRGENGEMIARSEPGVPLSGLHTASSRITAFSYSITDHETYHWMIHTQQPLYTGSKYWGSLHIGIDLKHIQEEIRTLFLKLYFFTLLLILITALVLYILIGHLTNSLRTLAKLVDKVDIDSEQFSGNANRHDEIGILINHFRALETRLKESRHKLLEAQKQLYQAEKLASIGRLSSGVAHEINNPLNGIKSCIYALEKSPEDLTSHKKFLKLIREGVNHIEMVVQKLLGFARQQPQQYSRFPIETPINKSLDLIAFRLEQYDIELKCTFASKLPLVYADEQMIQEVTMNLLLNALDAVDKKGIITIRTFINEGYVCFEIKDNGCGIPMENIPKIFDPFYTTKEEGKGTGLGLSVSLGIVESFNGFLDVRSVSEEGSTFTVSLPAG